MLVLKVSGYCIRMGVQRSDFSECSIMFRTEFQQSDQIWSIISPKPLIVYWHANNRWKYQKVFYNSCICLLVRFSSEQSQIYNFWLLLIVKLDLISLSKICFKVFSVDSRMAIFCGVSTTWWGVYCVSVSAPSIRWCRSATRTRSNRFPSIARLLGIFSLPILESLAIMEPLIKSLNRVPI
jgi:hypothetical protein